MSDIKLDQPAKTNEENKKTPLVQTSLFFGRFAIWVFLAILLMSIWFRILPLAVVSTFLLLMTCMITLWKSQSLMRVVPALEMSRSRLFATEEFTIQASMLNDKWLPLIWLEWELPEYPEIIWGDDRRERYIVRFLWLLWYQRVEWTMKGRALERGIYQLGEVTLRSGDGFRFSETEQMQHLDRLLYVYPQLIPVQTSSFSPSFNWGAQGKQGGFLEDPLLVSGVRDYQTDDEWRRINWRATARAGALQTNVYQPVVNPELIIWIDVDGFAVNEETYEDPVKQKAAAEKKKREFEHFLSVIASVAVSYHEQGIHIGYASNALDYFGRKQGRIQASSKLTPFLDQLALITAKMATPKHSKRTEMPNAGKVKSPFLIFCRTIGQEHDVWYQRHKQRIPEVRFYYLFESEQTAQLAAIAKPITSFISD